MNTNKKAEDKILSVVLSIISQSKSALWGNFVTKLQREQDSTIPTACTDGRKLKYNPDYILELDYRYVETLVVHEAAHVFLDHHLRMEKHHDPRLANEAMDYVVNSMLMSEGYPIHPTWLHNPKYDWHTWDWENVYHDLCRNQEQDQKEQSQDPEEDCDGGSGDDESEDGNSKGKGSKSKGDPKSRPGDVSPMMGEDGDEMTPEEKQEKLMQSSVERAQAQARAEKLAGVGEGLRDVIGRLNAEGVADWKEVLSRFVGEVYKDDYSYLSPNKRYLDAMPGIIMPSLRSEGIAKVAFAVDISGSVSTNEVRVMMCELMLALEVYADASTEVSVPIVYFTHRVAHEEVVESGDWPNPPCVSGGTDYAPVMAWCRDHAAEHDIHALVVQTDGECQSWGREPPVPVLWVLSGNHMPLPQFKPPFGEVVILGQKGRR
jgi:predicted metal-dependent peptidase